MTISMVYNCFHAVLEHALLLCDVHYGELVPLHDGGHLFLHLLPLNNGPSDLQPDDLPCDFELCVMLVQRKYFDYKRLL